MTRSWASPLDWALRAVFFIAAPFLLVRLATLVPITGTLVDVALALAVLFAGEWLQTRAKSSSLVRKAFAQAFAFDAYYRAHPPKPFVYYALYPLLFPYWLWNREARQEFLLFKSYTLLGLGVLVATNSYHFVFLYRPELDFRDFLRPFLLGLFVESMTVLALLMPLVTTVVALHRRGAKAGLYVLLAVGAISTTVGLVRLGMRHAPVVSLETRQRIVMRTAKARHAAEQTLEQAVRSAYASSLTDAGAIDEDGIVSGAPKDAARAALAAFYRKDEVAAFELWANAPGPGPKLLVLYAEGRRERRPIFVGLDMQDAHAGAKIIRDTRSLPRPARRAMKEADAF